MDFSRINSEINRLESCINSPKPVTATEPLAVGVDLGTAYIVVVVLNRTGTPVGCALEYSQVVRDGLVVDYAGAIDIVKRLVKQLEEQLGRTLEQAAIAIPPGTEKGNSKTHCYVIEAAGLAVSTVIDEPVAANAVLQIAHGVIVDIGGGTTGLAVIEDGKVVYTADEATGGTHISLVLAGHHHVSFAEAEKRKHDQSLQEENLSLVRPVIQKMATIVRRHTDKWQPKEIFLVGGTCCLAGIEEIFSAELDLPVFKPGNPLLVTPLGIALNDSSALREE